MRLLRDFGRRADAWKAATAKTVFASLPGFRGRYVQRLILVFGLVGGLTTRAATYTWDGGGGDDNWSTAANWNNTLTTGNALVFAGTTRLTNTNDLSGYTFTSITFNNTAGAFVLGGNSFTLSGNLTNSDADTQTINNAIIVSGSQNWTATSGNLVFGGGITATGSRTLTFNGNSASFGATVNGVIGNGSGTLALTKSNAGSLTLANTNTYTGTTTLSGGTLNLNATTATGTGAMTISGGTLDNTSGGSVTLANSGYTLGGTLTYAGTLNRTLDLGTGGFSLGSANRTFTINGGTLTIGGVVNETTGSRAVIKEGTGTLELTGANLYAGKTTINAGTLSVSSLADGGSASSIGNSSNVAANLVLNGGALRYTGGAQSTNRLFTLGLGASAGNIEANGSGALNLTNTGNMAFSGSGNRTLTLSGTNTDDNILAAVIGDSGGNTSLTKSGVGTWVLSGTNTYNGITTLTGGILSVSNLKDGLTASNIGDSANTAGNLVLDGGTLRYTGAAQNTNRLFTLGLGAGAGGIEANGSGELNFTNTGSMGFSGSGARTLTLSGTNAGANTLAAVIGDSGGATSLVKSGTGMWSVSGGNTFSGGATLNAGTLNINNATALGTGTFTIAGGTIDNTSGGAITLSNNNVQSWNADFAFTGTNNLNLGTGTVTLGANRIVTINGGSLTVGGTITDGASSFSLTKAGAGTLTLNGAGTFDGGTTLSAGTLNINNTTALGTGIFTIAGGTIDNTSGGAITLSNNNVQNWNGDFAFTGTNNLNLGTGDVTLGATRTVTTNGGNLTVDGSISGPAFGVTKSGTGTLTLGGSTSNTYSGTTTVNGGLLVLAKSGGATAVAGNLTIGDGTGTDTVQLSAANQIADTSAVTMDAAGTPVLNLAGFSERIGSLASSNTAAEVQLGSPGATTSFTVGNASNTTYAGAFTAGNANPSIVKEGTGTLTLTGNSSSFTGAVTVNAGTLNVQSTNALGTGTLGTTVNTSSTLALQGGITITNGTLSLDGSGAGSVGALTNVSGDNTWNGSLALLGDASITTQAGTLTLGATRPAFSISGHAQPTENGYITIGNQTLTFAGAGTAIVVNNSIRDFNGQTVGTSHIYPPLAVAYAPETTSPGNVIVNMTSGGSVTFQANANSYTGSTTVQNGTLILATKTNTAAPHDTVTDSFHAIGGSLIIGNGDATAATVKLGNILPASEVIASTSGITFYKDGILDLNGNGQTIDALTFNGGTVNLNAGTLYLNNDVTVNASAGNTAAINGSGQLSLTLRRAGGVDVLPDATRTFTVTGGVGNLYDLTISGRIQSGSLVKAGDGTMMLGTSNNTYVGTTAVTGGILNIQQGTDGSSRSSLGAGNGTLGQGTSVSSGATLQIQGGIGVTSEYLTLSGNGFDPGSGVLGALNNLSGSNTWGAAGNTFINLATDSRINSSAGLLTIAGNISSSANNGLTVGGSGDTTISGGINTGIGSTTSLTKDGSGTLILSGSNSYQGATNVTSGILSVQHNNGLGAVTTGANGTFVTSGAELQLSKASGLTIGGEAISLNGAGIGGTSGALNNVLGDNSLAGVVTINSASTIKSSAGTLTLSGGTSSANQDLIIAGAGNVTITGDMANGTGALTKVDAGTLTFAGTVNGTTGTVGAASLQAGNMVVGNGTQTTTLNTGAFDSIAGTTLTIATNGMVVADYASGSTLFDGVLAGGGTFEKAGNGILEFGTSFAATNLTLVISGGTLLLSDVQITVGTIHITGDTILDFNNFGGTVLSSASLLIDNGVTVTVNNWVSVANDAASSTIWYATSTLNGSPLSGSEQFGGSPLSQIDFTGYTPGLTTTWTTSQNGWFEHEIRPTPEPETYGALFLSGCLGLLGFRRWRSRRTAVQTAT